MKPFVSKIRAQYLGSERFFMWPGLKAGPVPSSSSAARSEDSRVITAKYNIADRRDVRTGSRLFFACRIEHITQMEMMISAPVTGNIGDQVLVHVDRLGGVRGLVSRKTRVGFVVSITATQAERARVKIRIDWFQKSRARKVVNNRTHDRFAPSNPHSTLIFSNGSTLRCFVIDMSSSGAAVSADVAPLAGTPLALGTVVGRVVRHLPSGFAIRFIKAVDVAILEDLLIKPSV
jgi:hypothetical protein